MGFAIGIIAGSIAGCILSIIFHDLDFAKEHPFVGNLREIDEDVFGPCLTAEFTCPIEFVLSSKYVVLKVIRKNDNC